MLYIWSLGLHTLCFRYFFANSSEPSSYRAPSPSPHQVHSFRAMNLESESCYLNL
jgi:hypothetical protein